jgi:hypothetical protein
VVKVSRISQTNRRNYSRRRAEPPQLHPKESVTGERPCIAAGGLPSGSERTIEERRFNEHFGVCPKCGEQDGWLSFGPDHWFVCHKHRVRWEGGSNLFSEWRDRTPEEFARNGRLLLHNREVEPIVGSLCLGGVEESLNRLYGDRQDQAHGVTGQLTSARSAGPPTLTSQLVFRVRKPCVP